MKRVCVFLFAVMCTGVVYGQSEKQKVSVYIIGGQEWGVNKVLGDQLVAAFARSGSYIAIERTNSFLAELTKVHGNQRSGNVSDLEIAELGKQFGEQLVCVADISEVFGTKYVSARLIDVKTAEVINTSNATSPLDSMDELLKVADIITKKLVVGKMENDAAEKAREKANAEAREGQIKKEEWEKRREQTRVQGYFIYGNLLVSVPNDNAVTWENANLMAKNVSFGGYRDWRLPTISELLLIVNNKSKIIDDFGVILAAQYYWSSENCKCSQLKGYFSINSASGNTICICAVNCATIYVRNK